VRIARALKNINFHNAPVNFRKAEYLVPPFLAVNPSAAIPTLPLDDGAQISQPGAIIHYLAVVCFHIRLRAASAMEAVRVRQIADIIGCDIHPF
jgi:maleylacetoacetate isomerase